MNKTKNSDIQYRRGIVLGLTFAELLILLLFVVLLVLGSTFKKDNNEASEMRALASLLKSKDKETFDEMTKLLKKGKKETAYQRLKEILPTTNEISEMTNIIALIKVKNPDSYHKIQEHLKLGEKEKAYQIIVESSPTFKKSAQEIILHKNMIGDCRAQNKHLVQIKNVGGRGGDFPSCWFDENGAKQFLYNIELTDKGIVIHNNEIPMREEEKNSLPLKEFKIGSPMQPGEFIKAGQKIKKLSDSQNCRFFVKISDKTGPDCKEHYKKLRNAVENIFYKKDV